MTPMEPTTASQASTEPITGSDTTEKAYGELNFEPDTVPGLIGGYPEIRASATKFFRKLFRRNAD